MREPAIISIKIMVKLTNYSIKHCIISEIVIILFLRSYCIILYSRMNINFFFYYKKNHGLLNAIIIYLVVSVREHFCSCFFFPF